MTAARWPTLERACPALFAAPPAVEAPTPLYDALKLYADEYPTANPCRRAYLRDLVSAAGFVPRMVAEDGEAAAHVA